MTEDPLIPIIYVRGYAGSDAAVEETVATPYMGFNLGSTKVRQRWDGSIRRHVFESPLVRLMKDFAYRDVYEHGDIIASSDPIGARSIIIYRYYDQVSSAFGDDNRPDIEVFAQGLSNLVLAVRRQVCLESDIDEDAFRCYLVAHSMGGLICRAFIQNHDVSTPEARGAVSKIFTYATPHNGIDVRILGNIPGFFTRNNVHNFNRKHMKQYLKTSAGTGVNSLDGKFDPNRFFTLVGTNNRDYSVASGWSSRVVGPMSDGLVQIKNATLSNAPRAYVHRSHSGHYGIVNSEDGYQNLVRFLFGDVKVLGVLEIHEITLPRKVQDAREKGKKIHASYHVECILRPRGARYDLHRRVVDEGSAVYFSYDELFDPAKANRSTPRTPTLFTAYLSQNARTRSGHGPLVFALDLKVLVPEYEIDGFAFLEDHVEGSAIFTASFVIAAIPPSRDSEEWSVRYGFNSHSRNPTPRKAPYDGSAYKIPVVEKATPGIDATLKLIASAWS